MKGNEKLFLDEVVRTAGKVRENFKISIDNYQYHRLPTTNSYHLELLNRARSYPNLTLLNRVNAWLDLGSRPIESGSRPRDQKILRALQYHPNYPGIMEEFAQLEKQTKTDTFFRECQSILYGPFIPLKIRDTIFQRYSHCYRISFHSGPVPVKLVIVERNQISSKTLFNYCRAITIVLTTILISYQIDPVKTPIVNIYLYPTKFRKSLPKENHLSPDVLTFLQTEADQYRTQLSIENYSTTTGVNEVNSAMCTLNYSDPRASYVVIFRREEWINRLCHELVHYFKLEKVRLPSLTGSGINSHLRVNPSELITEGQTYFLWTVYRLLENTSLSNWSHLQRMLREDQAYLIKVGHQFLTHYQTNLGELYGAKRPIVNINSNAFYYYVLRAIIWTEFDQTLIDLMLPKNRLSTQRLIENLAKKMRTFDSVGLTQPSDRSLKFYL